MSGTYTEESADNSAKWSGEETEELASEGEAKTAVGVGVVPSSPAHPAVLASCSDPDSSISSPLHSALLAALYYVSVPPTRYFPPAVSASRSNPESSVSSPLHSALLAALLAALSSVSVPLTRYFPPAPSFCLPS